MSRAKPTITPSYLNERVATLEEKIGAVEDSIVSQTKDLRELRDALVKHQGFWGGVMLIFGAIAAFLGLIKDPLFRKLGLS